jgi:competence protein ComEC
MNMPETLYKVPFVRFVIPLIAGILTGIRLPLSGTYSIILLIVFLALFLCFLLDRKRNFHVRWLFGFCTFVFLFFLGIAVSVHQKMSVNVPVTGNSGQLYMAKMLDTPDERPSTVACLVSFYNTNEEYNPRKAILYIAKDSSSLALQQGTLLLFAADLSANQDKPNPEEFDYNGYLNNKGIARSVYLSSRQWMKIADSDYFSIVAESKRTQNKLISVFKDHGIDGDEFAILSALALGNKEYLDTDLKNSYAATGASHILAVSGLHVGVLFFILNFLLELVLKGNRFAGIKIIILILSLWSYAFITGLSPSVVRAAVMLSFSSAGIVLKRTPLIYNTIGASAFLMLLFNPFYLFDVSFQLSYAAVLSIVFFQPKIYNLFRLPHKLPDKLWSLFSVSLAAQLGTFPLAIYYFNQFPTFFWLSGFIVVPASGLIIYLVVFLLIFSPIPFIGDGVAFLLKLIVGIMNKSIRFIEELPGALFRDLNYEVYDLIFIYLIIICLAFYVVKKQVRLVLLSLSILFGYMVVDTIGKYVKMNRTELVVYNIPGTTAINKIQNGTNALFYNGNLQEIERRTSKFRIRNNLPEPVEITEPFFVVGNKRVFILHEDFAGSQLTGNPLNVDFLIMTRPVSYSVNELMALFDFEMLIFDSSVSNYQINKWISQCNELNIPYYNVKKEGAYQVRF